MNVLSKITLSCVVATSLLFGAYVQSAEDNWVGNPDTPISPDNPYLKIAEASVSKAMTVDNPDVFWLTWGATAKESSRYGDPALKEKALAATDALAEKLRAKPTTHWSITMFLECVYQWNKSGAAPEGKVRYWLDAAKASVDMSSEHNQKGLDGAPDALWSTVAPNSMSQSAAILALAGELYGNPAYTETARQIVASIVEHQLPGGAFSYIRDSGPSPVYFGFNATFLGRYYQLTRDPVVKDRLTAMAGYTHEGQLNGLLEGSSTPWWKHHWGQGGPMHGVEVVAGVSRDRVAREMAERRIKAGQTFWFTHVAMDFWDPSISVGDLGADACRMDGNINGPLLRQGTWEVVMPFTSYGDTSIGVALANEKIYKFDNYLETASLPIMLKDVGDFRGRDNSLFMIPSDEVNQKSSVVGDGWIASGSVYHPRRGVYGEYPYPPAEGWVLAQVWFANEDGVAGWLDASADGQGQQQPGALYEPRGVLVLGEPVEAVEQDPLRFYSKGLSLALWGNGVSSGAVSDSGKRVHTQFKEGASDYGVSIVREGSPWVVERMQTGSDVIGMRVVQEGKSDYVIYFNPSNAEVSVSASSSGTIVEQDGMQATCKADDNITLRPFATAVLISK